MRNNAAAGAARYAGIAADNKDHFLSLTEVYVGKEMKILRAMTIHTHGYIITDKDDDVWAKSPGDYMLHPDWTSTVSALRDREIYIHAAQEVDMAALDR